MGSGGLILKTITGGLTSANQSKSSIPSSYILNQNYPNPFNPNTVISYQLAVSNYISLKVYDVQGKEIKTLVNEKQNAGYYQTKFDAEDLPSGIYYYSLFVNGNLAGTRKMILIR